MIGNIGDKDFHTRNFSSVNQDHSGPRENVFRNNKNMSDIWLCNKTHQRGKRNWKVNYKKKNISKHSQNDLKAESILRKWYFPQRERQGDTLKKGILVSHRALPGVRQTAFKEPFLPKNLPSTPSFWDTWYNYLHSVSLTLAYDTFLLAI